MIHLKASFQRVLVTDLPYGRTRVEHYVRDEQGHEVTVTLEFNRGSFADYCYSLGVPIVHAGMGPKSKWSRSA